MGAGALTPVELRSVLEAGPVDAAPVLLGCTLSAHNVTVRIVEVEAYGGVGEDPGSHAHRGRTPRNAPMFGPPGSLYVYFTYGMHWCVNVVTGPPGAASAVLIRAGEVIDGVEVARDRRPGSADRDLARGPARLARALALGGDANATDLLDGTGPASLTSTSALPPEVLSGPRTGVAGAGAATPWRFWIPGELAVSRYRPAVRRARTPGPEGISLPGTGGSAP